MRSFFQLGKNEVLSCAELSAFFPQIKQYRNDSNSNFAYFDHLDPISYFDVVSYSGGVISAGEVLSLNKPAEDEDALIKLIVEQVSNNDSEVGLSADTDLIEDMHLFMMRLKQKLRSEGKKVRVVMPQHGSLVMQSAAVMHYLRRSGFVHFWVWESKKRVQIGKTEAVQDVDEWSRIDYGKPERRISEGMLPPKIARMMLNLGLSALQNRKDRPVVYDPFCGSGTMLIEGARLGCRTLGSDLSQAAIMSSQKNMDWFFRQQIEIEPKHPFFGYPMRSDQDHLIIMGDAVHLSNELKSENISVVVTEPYMGPLFVHQPSLTQAKNQAKGLFKLYLGFFKSLKNILPVGGVVVFSLPFYRLASRELRIPLIDRLEDIGYNQIEPSIDYFREKTVVGREIIQLRLK